MPPDSPAKPIPRATYRLQFSRQFGFRDAAQLAPYLAKLGISHVYASPYLKARPGSAHGYDITDHCALNPELGDAADFEAFIAALVREGMGHILDFVPNHMGVGGSDNMWWLDVLEWGQDSPYAGFFDIDWEPERRYLTGKLLVPFLGDQYGAVLEDGKLSLAYDAAAGEFAVWAYDTHKLPICPVDYGRILDDAHPGLERLADSFRELPAQGPHIRRRARDLKRELAELTAAAPQAADRVQARLACLNARPDGLDALHHLIQDQHWRAAYFRVAADDINYRRFFNINDLAGLQMEQLELFQRTHALVFQLIADGKLDGLRIDHIDGLLDPKGYCQRLVEQSPRPLYLLVEKILARHERLHDDWPVDGTTGYDFTNLLTGLFVDPAGEPAISRVYASFTGNLQSFAEVVRDCKFRIMDFEMASELATLALRAGRLARSNRRTCDFTNHILHAALREIIARFPVYRTYIDGGEPHDDDRRDIDWAVAQARRSSHGLDPSVFDFLHQALTSDLVAHPQSGFSRQAVLRLAMKVQQYSGPVMAKGLEDTAFYRFNRLLALNEVGGNPDIFGVGLAGFHAANSERLRRWPGAMLATSTHDTKRGEDARARLAVLSEIPEEWERHLDAWTRLLRARRGEVDGSAPPHRNDEYMIYQMLLGAWPAEQSGRADDAAAIDSFRLRLEAAVIKAIREAKTHSSWSSPDSGYEDAALGFIRDALDVSRSNAFLDSFLPLQERIARLGMVNSLSQTLLKLTVPGMPDIYQGAELWDFSLVDPDNRRPVDYPARVELLDRLAAMLPGAIIGLQKEWPSGAIKLAVTRHALTLRRQAPDLFARGGYTPLEAIGSAAEHLCAFLRDADSHCALVLSTRLPAALEARGGWGRTSLRLPPGIGGIWYNRLTGLWVEASQDGPHQVIAVDTALGGLPVALLVPAAQQRASLEEGLI
jgi:(1->4)-alpha-D-glucan 1-alpha-D-glucosylmutase